ncbi:hypothetical protein P3X46_033974 [Hevea brasiliensis]|uniref:Uncharacterized protein n=1 Tax=Hevea brasiliensis TaxID=3981 RepID=A0ABQ9KCB1_HEVBR|nr:hypothetical protein P3X46_033974 [Hevea brasiliensis]
MSSILISRRLPSKLLNLSPSSCVYSHFISQESQNHGFRLFPHFSIYPCSQQSYSSFTTPIKNHDFALSALEKSRSFSTFTREEAQSLKSQNQSECPSKIPHLKHKETEKPTVERDPNEKREVLASMMMKMYGMIKILGLLGVAQTGLGASISYINEGTISIKQVFVHSGVIITGTFCLMLLWKSAPSE